MSQAAKNERRNKDLEERHRRRARRCRGLAQKSATDTVRGPGAGAMAAASATAEPYLTQSHEKGPGSMLPGPFFVGKALLNSVRVHG